MTCSACGASNREDQRFCGNCGAALSDSGLTETSPPALLQIPQRPGTAAGQFLPGTIVADRYRIIGLLGRGGMGEVYRADDLKLGQPVALKFLPRDVERHPGAHERFLTEVRLALRVTHPNVCRVFDIGQIDDRHFLSMEYVDGEDLASLLRRIGRLPEDKAVEIARQLCAGLAAAHEEGVLHRDLKPANVMIDGRGRAKITDFGLAGATTGIRGPEARAGTPLYMAPEQLEGKALTERTDLYSLGLVLYELFTGRRAFDEKHADILGRPRTSTPTSPSAHVSGLAPEIERAIMRCVDPDPARRPSSAAALAAALPGGDPLAMALAAGETPSPDVVARAGGAGALHPGLATAALVIILVGIGVIWSIGPRAHASLLTSIPFPKPPAELAVIARSFLATIGHRGAAAYTAFGFQADVEYFEHVERQDRSPQRWASLPSVAPAPVTFWYRESPRSLSPIKNIGTVGPADPPLVVPGMVRIRLDPAGRLQQFWVIPVDVAPAPAPRPEPDWTPFFAAAGFDVGAWTAATPRWAPPDATDVWRAWTKDELRIEAAAFRGDPVWFTIVPPWRAGSDRAAPLPPLPFIERAGFLVRQTFTLILGIAGISLARRNIRLGRSDRRGAFRLAVVYVAVGVAHNVLRISGDPATWFPQATRGLALQLYDGVLIWVAYVALEPYVRRFWPDTLIAWSRMLEGRLRDPMIGRHLLAGALAGLLFSLIFMLPRIGASWFGTPPPEPDPVSLLAVIDARRTIAMYFGIVQDSLFIPVITLLAMLALRVLLRSFWLAYLVLMAIVALVFLSANWGPQAPVAMAIASLAVLVLTRLGLLAFLVGIMYSSWNAIPVTNDPSSWFFPSTVVSMLLFAALAVYGFIISLGGRRLFDDPLAPRA